MALTTLTGQNIQDTYQKVVQTDGTNLADGTGSALPILFDGNNVTISGSLTANEYIISSSVTNITVATLSGSTDFGDDTGDTHKFTGSLFISGTYVGINNDNPNYMLDVGGDIHSTNILRSSGLYSSFGNFSSHIYAYGNIIGDNGTTISGINTFNCIGNAVLGNASTDAHTVNGTLSATNNVTSTTMVQAPTGSFKKLKGDTTLATGLFINGTITSSGNISSSGTIIAGEFLGIVATAAQPQITSVGTLTGLNLGGNLNLANNSKIVSTNESTTYIKLNNDDYWIINANGIDTARFTSAGTVFNEGAAAAANFRVESLNDPYALYIDGEDDTIELGRSATTHVTASGTISSSGDIIADQFNSKGSQYKLNGDKALYLDSTDLYVGHDDHKTYITSSGVVDITGNITASGNISSSGTVTGLSGSFSHILGNSPITVQDTITFQSHVTASGNISSSGNIYAKDYFDDGININTLYDLTPTGTISSSAQLPSGILSSSAQLPAGVISSSLQNLGNITGSTISSSGDIIAPNIYLDAGGVIDFTNVSGQTQYISGTDNNITIDGDNYVNIYSDVGTLIRGGGYLHAYDYIKTDSYISASGYLTAQHITASGNISASATIIGNIISGSTISGSFVGDGSGITNLVTTANVTTAGALMDSEVDADIKTLELPASTTISTFGASLIDDAAAVNARTTLGLGTVATTAATAYATAVQGGKADSAVQPADTFFIGTTSVAHNRSSAALTLAGITLTTPDIGTPSAGDLSSCTFPTLNQNTTGTAATVTTAAQPNITSVGTLTSLTSTGNISSSLASTGSFGRVEATNVHASGYILAKTPIIVLNTTDNSTDMYINYAETDDGSGGYLSIAQGGTKIPWDKQEIIDTSFFAHNTSTNNERITVTYAGRYEIIWMLTYNKDVARACPVVRPYVNGAWGGFRFQTNPMYQRAVGTNNNSLNGSYIMELAAGDYISLASGHVPSFGATPSGGGMPLTQYNATHGFSKLMIKMIG
tara:strand:- start:7114 stop:10119 length:3006 start_codon:yes stop_codon:yes gene_type:complete